MSLHYHPGQALRRSQSTSLENTGGSLVRVGGTVTNEAQPTTSKINSIFIAQMSLRCHQCSVHHSRHRQIPLLSGYREEGRRR
ncbi:hypothetical protein JAAARDRAFT_62347 [Jaapia argillacea MUCL 33604]|uniref:Uncharacterized protein n=1 Tax=Jaapia argillacea MUCL 33604 TaxID=933084 RepID=A0A067PMU4_9AGAM|nr:hypothetical protein JAAARDRAFT_62347 [Jaapia argillacea MUCL 33604]